MKSAATDAEDNAEVGDYKAFGGMDESETTPEEEGDGMSGKTDSPRRRKEGAVDWAALFRANIIMNNGQEDRGRQDSPSPSIPEAPVNDLHDETQIDTRQSAPPSPSPIPITPQPLRQRDVNIVTPASNTHKRKQSDEVDDVNPDDIPYVKIAKDFLERVLDGRCPMVIENWCSFEEHKGFPQVNDSFQDE